VAQTGALTTLDAVALSRPAARAAARSHTMAVAFVLVLYLVGAGLLAWVRLPQRDEGQVANAGYELAYHGRLAMPMWTPWIPTMDRYVYATMPLHYVQLAPWVRAFGPGIRAERANTVLWGLLLVLSWYAIVRMVTHDRTAALLGVTLVGLNYDVINLTSARYDPMCAALAAGGLAVYLGWRERALVRAVAAANACFAAAMLTHPFGVTGPVSFAIFFLLLDWRRLSPKVIAAAAVPYAVGFGAWGLYILQDPAAFHSQMEANVPQRFISLANPWRAAVNEVWNRYLVSYAGWRPDAPVLMRVKVLFLAAYVVSAIGVLTLRRLRSNRAVVALVMSAAAAALVIMLADSLQRYVYLIYVLPACVAILAIWSRELLARGGAWRTLIIAAVVAWVVFSAGTLAFRIRLNDYDRLYRPTLAYLQQHVAPGDRVIAGGEFGPGLGFASHVLEDAKLGYGTNRKPEWIVFDKSQDSWLETYATSEPDVYRYTQQLLLNYDVAFELEQPYNYYRIYRLRTR
jgi:4-amino-4-deoxy-L-arabinose transferase-like glycosyltransferase